jgi:fructose-1,6-bisphosphatase/inositol monophosphatase family enzyme
VDVVAVLDAESKDLRRSGCAALAACQVACGELDAMYGPGLEVWDIAAGALIAKEAGAVVLERPDGVFLVSSPGVSEEFFDAVERGLSR